MMRRYTGTLRPSESIVYGIGYRLRRAPGKVAVIPMPSEMADFSVGGSTYLAGYMIYEVYGTEASARERAVYLNRPWTEETPAPF